MFQKRNIEIKELKEKSRNKGTFPKKKWQNQINTLIKGATVATH